MRRPELKPYRVMIPGGVETTLMLSEATASTEYPTAREVKPGVVETKKPAVKRTSRRNTAKRQAKKD